MGLLDRWSKKQQKEQLEEVKADKKTEATKVEKTEAVSEKPAKKTSTKKTTAKASTKKVAAKAEPVEKVETSKTPVVSDPIIVRPLVTEKIAVMGSQNKYGFVVEASATKTQIKKAVLRVYGVLPAAVNVINMQGKSVRFGRSMGRRSDYKKAVVTLPAGKTISVHSGV